MRFNKFDEVVKWYEQTKPIVSKNHTREDDIRPIGARRRKWERIKKVDAETYLLLDGNYTRPSYQKNNPSYDGYEQYEQDMAAIMWKREADGDYVYIRNGTEGSAHMSRYTFLQWYMPMNAAFRMNQQGKHWVRAQTPTGWEDFPLPKTTYRWDWNLHKQGTDDGKRLKFRVNEDGTFTRIGEAFKVLTTTVDKELKKQWKPLMEAFYAHAAALAPMLDTSYNARSEYRKIVAEWGKENNIDIPEWGGLNHTPNSVVRQIVEQEDHALRIPLMALVIDAIDGKRKIESQEDLSRIKSSYNRLMNKALGMYETKEV
jgi:hypothetical protein